MYDAALERYIPVLMAMARIYWDRENYPVVEKLFRQAAEFCSDHDTWKLNAAHVFFMEEKFKVHYYTITVLQYEYMCCAPLPGDGRWKVVHASCLLPTLLRKYL